MNGPDLLALTPWLTMAATLLAAVVAVALWRRHGMVVGLVIAGMVGVCGTLPVAAATAPRVVGALLVVDRFALFYLGFVAVGTAVVAALAHAYMARLEEDPEELYLLLLLAALGAGVLVASRHVASLFLGLETLSVSLYALIGYRRRSRGSVEAGVKYLVLAAASSAFLLMGAALVFAGAGTLDLAIMARALSDASGTSTWLAAGFLLLLVGLGFKLALVPFHLWTPDVYVGAPAPVAAFVAAVSKGAVLAVLVRLALLVDLPASPVPMAALAALAVASMVVGSLLALLERNLKRLLAFSSIAHMGFAIVPLLAGGQAAAEAATFYLVAYAVTILAAFAVVAVLSGPERDLDRLEDYRGLFWRRPWPATVLCAAMVSLAGLPLTAGFMGKVAVVSAAVGAGRWLPVLVLAAASVVGVFYSLRLVIVMAAPADDVVPSGMARLGAVGGLVTALLLGAMVAIGIAPGGLMNLVASTRPWSAPATGAAASPAASGDGRFPVAHGGSRQAGVAPAADLPAADSPIGVSGPASGRRGP